MNIELCRKFSKDNSKAKAITDKITEFNALEAQPFLKTKALLANGTLSSQRLSEYLIQLTDVI